MAEFLITSIDVEPGGPVRTEVRYEIAGPGTKAWRLAHVGVWRMSWTPARGWRVRSGRRSRTRPAARAQPIFSEVTAAALGGNESFRRQLGTPLDDWMATFDSVLTRDSNGHHGVSVGDADGDGLEDLYVAQPAGLPNRLYRARGDATFEDVTERAGLGVLDDTAQSLFADVDNDGDQDLVLATGTRPLLFVNDGKGRFTPVADAFRFQRPLQGSLTSIAMADYDRDGFLDLYLCVYSYFYGAGEDKAGTPMPYHDARNGPPGVLFRNDGRGTFVDATAGSGARRRQRPLPLRGGLGRLRRGRLDRPARRQRLRHEEPLPQPRGEDGKVTFEDVAEKAGVLDHGAGMSAAFLDYDNDGRLDIYTGNMWSDAGLRVTAASDVHAGRAGRDPRALSAATPGATRSSATSATAVSRTGRSRPARRWAAGPGRRTRSTSTATAGRTSTSPTACSRATADDLEGFFWRQVVARSPLTRVKGTPYDEAWRAINQLLIHGSIAGRQRNVFLRNDGRGGFDDVSAAVGLDLDQDGRSFARPRPRPRRRSGPGGDGGPPGAAAPCVPERRRAARRRAGRAARRHGEQPRRRGRARHRRDGRAAPDQGRSCGLGVPLAALEGAAVRPGAQHARREDDGGLAVGTRADIHGRPDQRPRPRSSRAAR